MSLWRCCFCIERLMNLLRVCSKCIGRLNDKTLSIIAIGYEVCTLHHGTVFPVCSQVRRIVWCSMHDARLFICSRYIGMGSIRHRNTAFAAFVHRMVGLCDFVFSGEFNLGPKSTKNSIFSFNFSRSIRYVLRILSYGELRCQKQILKRKGNVYRRNNDGSPKMIPFTSATNQKKKKRERNTHQWCGTNTDAIAPRWQFEQ